jgi:hypothetical protein
MILLRALTRRQHHAGTVAAAATAIWNQTSSWCRLGRQQHQHTQQPKIVSFSSFYGGGFDGDDENGSGRPGATKNALVLGSSGALGSTVSRYLSQNMGMKVLGADVVELPSDLSGDWELDGFVPLPMTGEGRNLADLTVGLVRGVDFFLQGYPQRQERRLR